MRIALAAVALPLKRGTAQPCVARVVGREPCNRPVLADPPARGARVRARDPTERRLQHPA
jgi:hypothetical protein